MWVPTRREGVKSGSQSLNTDQGNSESDCDSGVYGFICSSQSLNTDQGNSDGDVTHYTGGRNEQKSQSLNTDQGNSDYDNETLSAQIKLKKVAIPQYRSGQFGHRFCHLAHERPSLSQSLNTDQGNSDSGLPRFLIINHLAGHFG